MSDDLEKKVTKVKLPRTVARRLKALEQLPHTMFSSVLEAVPTPIIIYEGVRGIYRVAYANPAAIEKSGYKFEDILRFNDATLDTGEQKSRIDKVFRMCERAGWKDPDLEFSIMTEDKNELLFDAHLVHERIGVKDYWTAISEIRKYGPKSIRGMMKNMWRKCMSVFRREIDYVKAPEQLTPEFVGEYTKRSAVANSNNLVIDFVRVLSVDESNDHHTYKILKGFSQTYPNRLFLVNVNDVIFDNLRQFNIPINSLYKSRQPQISFSLA